MPLLRRDELLAQGHRPTELARAVRAGRLVRVRAGVYAPAAMWDAAKPEQRVIARAHALDVISREQPIFSHETAAALHGLALYRPSRDRVHAIVPSGRPGAAEGVVRHRGDLGAEDVVERRGLLCTSLARTVSDVARTATFEQAVTIADGALRQLFVSGPDRYDAAAAGGYKQTVLDIVKRSAHGQTNAGRVLRFADGRAQLPGESVSRVRLRALGFRDIRLQVAVPAPRRGAFHYVDFGLEDAVAFGEFDGAIKYTDGALLNGRSTFQVLDEEKQREDWIRGVTQRRYARWGWPHIDSPEVLGARLAAFGIHPPG